MRCLVGMELSLLGPEGERNLVTHFLAERDAQVRRQFLAMRERDGRLKCDACAVDLGAKYGRIFSQVVEVHHRIPVARGVRRATVEELNTLH